MPVSIFGAPVGVTKPKYDALVAGTPGYNEAVVGQAAEQSRPYFDQNRRSLESSLESRGLTDSGIGLQAELGQKEAFLRHLGDASTRAALHGADVGEENRRRTEGRGWQVEDRDIARADLRRRAEMEQDAADQAMWGNIISGAAGAVGGYFGGPIGAGLASKGSKALFDQYGNPTSYPQDQEIAPPPDYDDPNGPPPYFGGS